MAQKLYILHIHLHLNVYIYFFLFNRKSQQGKMVCHVTADNLSTDLWAWRKYGQKPIKGSPYPRYIHINLIKN
jgi:hypothetical protein